MKSMIILISWLEAKFKEILLIIAEDYVIFPKSLISTII